MENTNLENICRTCLKNNVPLRSVFEVEIFDDYAVRMVDFIRNITSIKIARGDGLPENLCLSCVEQICHAYTFTKICITSDAKLRLLCNPLISTSQRAYDKVINFDLDEVETNEVLVDSDFEVVKEEPDEQEYECYTCKEMFSTKDQLTDHSITHEQSKQQCYICLQHFDKQMLKVHIEKKHFENSQSDQKIDCSHSPNQHNVELVQDQPYPCTNCKEGFLTAESLRQHMELHGNVIKKHYVCDACGKEFPYPSVLSEHAKMHTGEKPFLCSFCGKSFRQNGALAYHVRVHTGFRPHKCQVCSKGFTSKSVLKGHMRRHTDERPFVCDVCGMAFRQSSDLKSHHDTHTGVKRAICTLCGKSMSTTGQLTVHLRSHTGERPFYCDICGKAFVTRTLVIKHRRIHTGEKPYKCIVCGRAFNQSSSLKSHGLIHMKNTPDKVIIFGSHKVSSSLQNSDVILPVS